MMNICRLCLYKGDQNHVVSVWNAQDEDLSNQIWSCVSIRIKKNDDLPDTICLSCIHQVNQWTIFKETCQKSNNLLLYNFIQKKCDNEQSLPTNELKKTSSTESEIETQCWKNNLNVTDELDISEEETVFQEEFHDLKHKLDIPQLDYICDICKRKFETCKDYLDHQPEHDGHLVFQCDKCSEVFDSRDKIVQHDKNHKTPCLQCGKIILKNSMKLHLIQHSGRHMCNQCSSRFNSRATLAQHIIAVHTDIKNHVCDSCGKKFSSLTALHIHMKSHSDERPYKCKQCSYAGKTASSLYLHMSKHADYTYICEVCSKTFKSSKNLNDHLKRVHNKVQRYECNYCNKKYAERFMLTTHLRSHTGVRPYKCTICEKAFTRADYLKDHIVTHTKRTYECLKCNKKLISKRGTERHICKLNF